MTNTTSGFQNAKVIVNEHAAIDDSANNSDGSSNVMVNESSLNTFEKAPSHEENGSKLLVDKSDPINRSFKGRHLVGKISEIKESKQSPNVTDFESYTPKIVPRVVPGKWTCQT